MDSPAPDPPRDAPGARPGGAGGGGRPARLSAAIDGVAHALAVWFGCGHVPRAPGTAGTLGAIPLYLAVRPHGAWAVAIAAAVVTAVGVWAAGVVARRTGLKDPQIVVIDEVAGVLVALLPAPAGWRAIALGVVAFRVFDQFKPWPARTFERRLAGGWGIVLDDVAAGAWGAAVVGAARWAGFI